MLGNLSGVEWTDHSSMPAIMLKKTLQALEKSQSQRPIFIKPHAVTDMEELQIILSDFTSLNYILTALHVSALATFCDLVVCNKFSFAMVDAWVMGASTVEFTDYPFKVRDLTSGQSMFPKAIDHFINQNSDQFSLLLEKPFDRLEDKFQGNDQINRCVDRIMN